MWSRLRSVSTTSQSTPKRKQTVVKRAELVHESKHSYRALYDVADTGWVNFIISVVDETWYKELEDAYMLYKNVTAQQLLEHLEDQCTGLHAIDAVYIPFVMQTFWTKAEGLPHYINIMEAAHKKYVRITLPVTDAVMQAIAFRSILASG